MVCCVVGVAADGDAGPLLFRQVASSVVAVGIGSSVGRKGSAVFGQGCELAGLIVGTGGFKDVVYLSCRPVACGVIGIALSDSSLGAGQQAPCRIVGVCGSGGKGQIGRASCREKVLRLV